MVQQVSAIAAEREKSACKKVKGKYEDDPEDIEQDPDPIVDYDNFQHTFTSLALNPLFNCRTQRKRQQDKPLKAHPYCEGKLNKRGASIRDRILEALRHADDGAKQKKR